MKQAIATAVARLSVIPFFPADEDARLEVMRTLEDMIGTETLYGSTPQQRLDWLVKAAVNVMRRWAGIPELRGMLCSRWRPADGVEAYSSLPGYSPEDSESRAMDEHRAFKAIEAGHASPKLLGPALKGLPPGHEVTADPELEASIQELAEKCSRPPVHPMIDEFRRMLREITTPPERRESEEPTPNPNFIRVTQEARGPDAYISRWDQLPSLTHDLQLPEFGQPVFFGGLRGGEAQHAVRRMAVNLGRRTSCNQDRPTDRSRCRRLGGYRRERRLRPSHEARR